MIVLDTCVLSESLKETPSAQVIAWIGRLEEESVFLPALVLGELHKGIELLEDGKKRQALRLWFEQLRGRFAKRILPFDEDTALVWGSLCAKLKRDGRPVPAIDGMIAATAIRHEALLATRNSADFEGTGVRLVDPWA